MLKFFQTYFLLTEIPWSVMGCDISFTVPWAVAYSTQDGLNTDLGSRCWTNMGIFLRQKSIAILTV